jgi:hypothetical protein
MNKLNNKNLIELTIEEIFSQTNSSKFIKI